MKKNKTFSFTRRFLITFAVLLFMTNVVLGVILMIQSTQTISGQVRKNMLNMSNTAADLISGDVLGSLSEKDIGSDEYNQIYDTLSAFQENADIEYIYAVRKISDEKFIFTVDTDPEDPADFGEEVLITEALISAGNGKAMVDRAPAEDEWGNFYSSYSPVFDSKGKVAGIIGVDFNSDWYDMEIGDNSFSIFVITGISIAFGGVIMLILAANIRSRFNNLSKELTVLSEDVDALTEEITSRNDYQESLDAKQDTDDEKKSEATDEIEMLGLKIRSMHKELNSYLAFVKDKANTDALTLVNNTTAYTERQKELESKIADGSACFSLAIFDINNLKSVNDQYGHHCGDLIIKAAADSLSAVFEAQDVFRIGGDEFIVIVEGMNKEQLEEKIGEVNKKIDEYNNSQKECEATLAVSVGVTQFDPDNDKQLRDAFNRADDLMYANKKEYYRDLSHDRRKR